MAENPDAPVLDHQLSDAELRWVRGVYQDFAAVRAECTELHKEFRPKEALREVLGRARHRLPTPMDLSGDGPWRNGRNSDGRLVACVFLNHVELHRHAKSRTDQFPMYVVGEADAFSVADDARPVLTPIAGGDHCHNAPNAPHAFLPKVGRPTPPDWEIAFVAITPRNLREDTQAVSEATRAAYKQVVGAEAPVGV
jgi:hypothetical protein